MITTFYVFFHRSSNLTSCNVNSEQIQNIFIIKLTIKLSPDWTYSDHTLVNRNSVILNVPRSPHIYNQNTLQQKFNYAENFICVLEILFMKIWYMIIKYCFSLLLYKVGWQSMKFRKYTIFFLITTVSRKITLSHLLF